jgi:hypothetical protein
MKDDGEDKLREELLLHERTQGLGIKRNHKLTLEIA